MTRLEAIKSLIEPADAIADVGCDHGLIAEYCAKSGMAKNVIASDISAECLKKAEIALGDMPNVTFFVCDGIRYECDTAVIAGMGGLLISKILTEAECKPDTVITCPHRDCYAVRKTLAELGYCIDGDVAIADRGKFYSVIRAKRCENPQRLSEIQLNFGVYCDEKCEALADYLSKLYNTYMKAPVKNAEMLALVREAIRLQNGI